MERSRMSRAGRLSEMPQRVADPNRMSMVYATPKNRPSFGKLNIPKAQSGTTDRRTSFFGSRTSGAGMPRNSSVYGGVGGEKIKDTRPLHDKTFVQQCIRQLCEFLSERGFPGTITTKSLQSPSSKEFQKYFEFIYCQIDETFQMPKSKVEEEIPKILKDLGYPFALSKSSMYSVGAPHTWPQVLGALVWLMDTVKIYNAMADQEMPYGDIAEEGAEIEDGPEYNQLILDYTAETYKKFMQGGDTFEEEDEECMYKLKRMYNVDEAQLATLEEKYQLLGEDVARLEKESHTDRLLVKKTEKMTAQADLQKLQNFHENLKTYQATLTTKNSELSDAIEAAGLQIETLKQEKGRLQNILKHQKFTPADIERINREKRELQQTLSLLQKNLAEAEQHLWNEEIALGKAKETVEIRVAEYHKLARKLKLIPRSNENAFGNDFEIETNSSMVQYKTQIQNPLLNRISQMEEECSRQSNMKLSIQESIEQLNLKISDKANDLKQLREQIRKVDEQLELDLQEQAREEQKWQKEMASVEGDYKALEKNVSVGYEEAMEKLNNAKQQYTLVQLEVQDEKRTVANNLATVFTKVTDHIQSLEEYMKDLRKQGERIYQEFHRQDQADLQKLKDLHQRYMAMAKDV